MAANTLPRNVPAFAAGAAAGGMTPDRAAAIVAGFLTDRRARHGDARMEADGDPAGDDPAGDDPADDPADDDKLGDAGQRALQAERDRRKAVSDQFRPWRELARDLGLTPEQARAALAAAAKGAGTGKAGQDGQQADEPVDVDAIKREARAEVAREANGRLVRAEVKALAAETFADAADAHLYLDLAAIDVDDDGEVDVEDVKRQLAAVLAAKPHLAKPGRRGPKADKSQGARGAAKSVDGYAQTRIAAAYAAREGASTT